MGETAYRWEKISLLYSHGRGGHTTRQTEDHSDEPGTGCLTFYRAQRERYSTEIGGKKSAVISMSCLMLVACQLRIMGNHRERVALTNRSFLGFPLGTHEKY